MNLIRLFKNIPPHVIFFLAGVALSHVSEKASQFASGTTRLVPSILGLYIITLRVPAMIALARPVMTSYGIATTATFIGSILSIPIAKMLGISTLIIGPLAATYTGGTINFMAVAESLDIGDPNLIAAGLAADFVTTAVHTGILWLAIRLFVGPHSRTHSESKATPSEQTKCADYIIAIIIACLIGLLGLWLTQHFHQTWITLSVVIILSLLLSETFRDRKSVV